MLNILGASWAGASWAFVEAIVVPLSAGYAGYVETSEVRSLGTLRILDILQDVG